MARPTHAAGLASPVQRRLAGTAVPDNGGPTIRRSRGASSDVAHRAPAAGPLPASGTLRLTKRRTVNTREVSLQGNGATLRPGAMTAVDRVSGRRSQTPQPEKRQWQYLMGADEDLASPPARSPGGIRVGLSHSISRERSIRRDEATLSKRRARSETYVVRAPYSHDAAGAPATPRRSMRRSMTPASTLRADVSMYSEAGMSERRTGRKRAPDRPADVDIFRKVATTPSPSVSKAVYRDISNCRSVERERMYLPTNWTSRGNARSRQEGMDTGFIRNPGQCRTADSLVNAWSVGPTAPVRKQIAGIRRVPGEDPAKPVPWDTQAASDRRYHRRGSLERSHQLAQQKRAPKSGKRQTFALPTQVHTSAQIHAASHVRSSSCSSIGSLGASESPRGRRRMYPQESSSVLLSWQ